MALIFPSFSLLHFSAIERTGTLRLPSRQTKNKPCKISSPRLKIVSKVNELEVNKRRSAHYHPSIWDSKLIESLNSPYKQELYAARLEKLKGDAKKLFKSTRDPFDNLKLVDSVQQLGLAYHFEEEIKDALNLIANSDFTNNNDLYTTALKFRILRQHAYPISSGVFDKFKSRDGRFMDSLSRDAAGLLSLYEASYLGMNGEDDLEEAKKFSSRHLKSLMGKMEGSLAEQVKHSLDMPLHWRMPRLETWNFVSNIYQNVDTKSTTLHELAKLDYNMVQSMYQKEVIELSRWWSDLGFREKLNFSRDRLMENYLWAMGCFSESQFSKFRITFTKFVSILSSIDDIYDIYGSLEELEHFTNAVIRWDVNDMEDLPEYMKICYLAMFNFANEIIYDVLKDHGLNILPHIKEAWVNLCRSYLVEALWFDCNYIPSVDEYLENAWISIGSPAATVHALFLQGFKMNEDYVDCFKQVSKLLYWSSLITRLNDDLGTSKVEMMRGDVMKSVQCYMSEKGISEEEARIYVKELISFSWKKLNEEMTKNDLPKPVVNMLVNMARNAQCIFQHGDGIGTSNGVTKDRLISLIIEPIPINELHAASKGDT